MRKGLISILLFVSVVGFGQAQGSMMFDFSGSCTTYYAESIWGMNNNGTDEKSNNTLTLGGSAAWSTHYLEGGYSLSTDVAANCYGAVPSIDYGNQFTFHIPWKKYSYSGTITLLGALTSNDGFELAFNTSTMQLEFTTGNGTSTQTATSSPFTAAAGSTWHSATVVVDKTAGTVLFYVNGTYLNSGSTRTDFETSTVARIGLSIDSSGDSWCYYDAVQIYKWKLSAGQVSDMDDTPMEEQTKCE